MSRDYTSTRHIPSGASKAVSKDGFCVVYFGKSQSGRLWAMGFHGKAGNHDFYHSFSTEEARAKYCAKFFESWTQTQARVASRKAEKKSFKHTLKVGDVLSTSWGYDQTNIEYFQVTKLIGDTMVEVREIGQEREETAFMSGKCVPKPNAFIGKPLRKRVLQGNTLDIHGGFGYASPEKSVEVAGVKVYGANQYSSYA